MPLLEVSHWTASESEDLTRPRSWTLRNRTQRFPNSVLGPIGTIVATPSVRASAIDVAPDMVVGLRCDGQLWTAFCFEVVSYTEVALWLACAPAAALTRQGLLTTWSWAVATRRIDAFKWTGAVDTAAIGAPSHIFPTRLRPRLAPADRHIAVRDADRQRRLHAACEILGRLPASHESLRSVALVLLDNLTVVDGDVYQVAGLAPSHRFAGSGWRVIEMADKTSCDNGLACFRDQVAASVRSAGAAGARPRSDPPGGDPDRSPPRPRQHLADDDEQKRSAPQSTTSGLLVACDVIASAIETAARAAGPASEDDPTGPVPTELHQLGDEVRREAAEAGLPSSAFDAIAGALSIARAPALAVATGGAFDAWLNTAVVLGLPLRALAAALSAQPVYDMCRLRPEPDDGVSASRRLDGLIDLLLDEVDRLVANAQEPAQGPLCDSPEPDRSTLVNAFDMLADLETSSPARDDRLLHAHVAVRLLAGRPTPDVVFNAVRAGLSGKAPGFLDLIRRARLSDAHLEIGSLAASDTRGLSLEDGVAALHDATGRSAGRGGPADIRSETAAPPPIRSMFSSLQPRRR